MSEWIVYLIGVSISADGRYKRRSKNMKNNSKYSIGMWLLYVMQITQ